MSQQKRCSTKMELIKNDTKGTPPIDRGQTWRQFAVASVANLMMLSFGLASGWPATILPRLMSAESPLAGGPVSLEDSTWLATLLTITGIPFTPVVAYMSERWGRKSVGYLTGAVHLVSNVLPALSLTIEAMYISRCLAGVACGCGLLFVPLYLREISDDTTRGPLGVLMTVIVNVGVIAAYIIGTYCSVAMTSWICVIPPAIFLVVMVWMPETPIYLLMKGQEEEAEKSLVKIRGPHYDVKGEIEAVKESLKAMKANASGIMSVLKELFTTKASRKAGLILIVLMLNQQFSGLFCIVSYTVQIFQEAGSQMSPYTSSIIVGFMMLLGTIISGFLCKLLGRKSLLIISDVFMAVSLFGMGLYFYLKHIDADTSAFGWLPVVCLSVYVTAFNIGMGPIAMVVFTEIFSPKLVSASLSLSGPLPGILSFVIGKFFYTVAELIGIYTCYWIFTSSCALGIVFIIFVVPETKNRSIDSILKDLEGINPEKTSRKKIVYDRVAVKGV